MPNKKYTEADIKIRRIAHEFIAANPGATCRMICGKTEYTPSAMQAALRQLMDYGMIENTGYIRVGIKKTNGNSGTASVATYGVIKQFDGSVFGDSSKMVRSSYRPKKETIEFQQNEEPEGRLKIAEPEPGHTIVKFGKCWKPGRAQSHGKNSLCRSSLEY